MSKAFFINQLVREDCTRYTHGTGKCIACEMRIENRDIFYRCANWQICSSCYNQIRSRPPKNNSNTNTSSDNSTTYDSGAGCLGFIVLSVIVIGVVIWKLGELLITKIFG